MYNFFQCISSCMGCHVTQNACYNTMLRHPWQSDCQHNAAQSAFGHRMRYVLVPGTQLNKQQLITAKDHCNMLLIQWSPRIDRRRIE